MNTTLRKSLELYHKERIEFATNHYIKSGGKAELEDALRDLRTRWEVVRDILESVEEALKYQGHGRQKLNEEFSHLLACYIKGGGDSEDLRRQAGVLIERGKEAAATLREVFNEDLNKEAAST